MLPGIYGDGDVIAWAGVAGDQQLVFSAQDIVNVVGDVYELTKSARGGDDYVEGRFAYGDALIMDGSSRGGDDQVVTVNTATDDFFFSFGFGDAGVLSGHAHGGNDVLVAEGGPIVTDFFQPENWLFGDGSLLTDKARGGDDTLYGLGFRNFLFGDANEMTGQSRGGNDTLIGGPAGTYNFMYGDASWMDNGTRAGDDRLVSGASNDMMWGDSGWGREEMDWPQLTNRTPGHDVFVFAPGNGTDSIRDFHHGEDKIDLSAFHLSGFGDLQITTLSDGSSLIQFGDGGTIDVFDELALALGQAQTPLQPSDFVF